MSVANLTRYSFLPGASNVESRMGESRDGEFVKYEEAMEASSNSLQQLKAEIAALAMELQDFNERRISSYGRITEIVAKMRQLSAV
jgi:hypothetical protein